MFAVVSRIVSKYSNMSYPEFIKKRILLPLGMNKTTFYSSQVEDSGLSQSFTPHNRRIPYWLPDNTVDLIAGAGGIISNAVDLVSIT